MQLLAIVQLETGQCNATGSLKPFSYSEQEILTLPQTYSRPKLSYFCTPFLTKLFETVAYIYESIHSFWPTPCFKGHPIITVNKINKQKNKPITKLTRLFNLSSRNRTAYMVMLMFMSILRT